MTTHEEMITLSFAKLEIMTLIVHASVSFGACVGATEEDLQSLMISGHRLCEQIGCDQWNELQERISQAMKLKFPEVRQSHVEIWVDEKLPDPFSVFRPENLN